MRFSVRFKFKSSVPIPSPMVSSVGSEFSEKNERSFKCSVSPESRPLSGDRRNESEHMSSNIKALTLLVPGNNGVASRPPIDCHSILNVNCRFRIDHYDDLRRFKLHALVDRSIGARREHHHYIPSEGTKSLSDINPRPRLNIKLLPAMETLLLFAIFIPYFNCLLSWSWARRFRCYLRFLPMHSKLQFRTAANRPCKQRRPLKFQIGKRPVSHRRIHRYCDSNR